jgi:hypothetical protein
MAIITPMSTSVPDLWSKAIQVVPPDTTKKAPLFGRNFRINVKSALMAVWHTMETVLHTAEAVVEHGANPMSWMRVGVDGIAAGAAVLETVQKSMRPLAYIAAIVLSSDPSGLTQEEFETRLETFLTQNAGAFMPWYLALTTERVAAARKALEDTDAKSLIQQMLKDKEIERVGDRIQVRDRYFIWGFGE